jgi:beta-mannosidase
VRSVPITLRTTAPALFVTLTTAAQGRFSDNAVLLLPAASSGTTVRFLSAGTLDYGLLASTLRAEHLQSYLAVS